MLKRVDSSGFDPISKILLAWPDELGRPRADVREECARLIRVESYQAAQAKLLALLADFPSDQELSWLLAYLYCETFDFVRAVSIASNIVASGLDHTLYPWSYIRFRCLSAQNVVGCDMGHEFEEIQQMLQYESVSLVWSLSGKFACAFTVGDKAVLSQCIDGFPIKDSIEFGRMKARLHRLNGENEQALRLIQSLVKRCSSNPGLLIHYCEAAIDAQDSESALPAMRLAYGRLGDHSRLLPIILQIKLLQRQPAIALRSTLLMQALGGLKLKSRVRHHTNQITSWEMVGRVDWFPCLLKVHKEPSLNGSPSALANMIYHMASIESEHSQSLAAKVFENDAKCESRDAAGLSSLRSKTQSGEKPLKIGWITPDIAPHPVSRFLYSFLVHAAVEPGVNHVVVSTSRNKDDGTDLKRDFAALPLVDVVDTRLIADADRIPLIRSLGCDVVIDLAGWTGGDFQQGFARRLAPVQLNYLGYFASTGNPQMDGWVGDAALFPKPMREWHTETIIRLQRCFIAWQPTQRFAEGRLEVAGAPSGGIRFGSFNHNRKLSDRTLHVWGQILARCPGSSLVLKANSVSDPGTQELLRRRMLRQGVNPDQVLWLPLADSHENHLRQYAEVDVALDCFPNGGCTTTCEALWMGTPVITKMGDSYVSRMSTAVLHGAELPQWCADSEQSYIELALQQADQLSWLRQNRDHWRRQVQSTPLGDAADLLAELCRTFQSLAVAL